MPAPHSSWAEVYDLVYEQSFGELYSQLTAATLEVVSRFAQPPTKIVDFGAGAQAGDLAVHGVDERQTCDLDLALTEIGQIFSSAAGWVFAAEDVLEERLESVGVVSRNTITTVYAGFAVCGRDWVERLGGLLRYYHRDAA